MAQLSTQEVLNHLHAAGFRGDDLWRMLAIAGRESSRTPDAHRTDQPKEKLSGDLGLFQINYTNWNTVKNALGLTDKRQLFDPAINAKAAKVLFDASGYQPWTAGPGGWTKSGDPMYGTNQREAQQAFNQFVTNGPTIATSGATSTETADRGRQVEYIEPDVRDPQRGYTIPDYQAPTADPKQQRNLTTLLQGFGIKYPDAPRATPQLLAYLRGLGVQVDTAEDQFINVREELQRSATDRLGDLAVSDQRRRRNLANDAQRRGALVSGATNSAFARQAEDYTRDQADVERSLAQQTAAAARARDTFADQQRQAALERTLSVETQQETQDAMAQAQTEAAQRALRESDLAYERQRAAERRRAQQQVSLYNQLGGAR